MKTKRKVYVIGAGFSVGLGYPLTSSLLISAWNRLDKESQEDLQKVIQFHYPNFTPFRKTSFPNIEQLLTRMKVNQDMFGMSRPADGGFTKEKLLEIQETLLYTISEWFHELYDAVPEAAWLTEFAKRLKNENAIIISFNWDLVLDHKLFSSEINAEAYGLQGKSNSVILLKPHGSLNWYEADKIKAVKADKRIPIFGKEDAKDRIEAFSLARGIHSKKGNQYMPLIVAPSYLKDFDRGIFKHIWQKCTEALSTADDIYFLGYSLPPDDMQAQFILRCGFYNQLKGRLNKDGTRYPATGASKITVINPDQGAAIRIESITEQSVKCKWISESVEKWLS